MPLPSASASSSEVLEVVQLSVKSGQELAFERAFAEAQAIISGTPGYLGHELGRCLESPSSYLLLVRWSSIEAHEQGFRQSQGYLEWKRLLHHFYDPFPTVVHYRTVFGVAQPLAQADPLQHLPPRAGYLER